jgi:hypothetical protein
MRIETSDEPSFERVIGAIEAAERAEGWLCACAQRGRYVVLNREFLGALGQTLRSLGGRCVVEVCAGDGELARALAKRRVMVIATDDAPRDHAVLRVNAGKAIRRYRPDIVVSSFAPCDAGVEASVLSSPSVQHYIMLGAEQAGPMAQPDIWEHPGWKPTRLRPVEQWMVCRHDVWLGPGRGIRRHGRAWLLSRAPAGVPVS